MKRRPRYSTNAELGLVDAKLLASHGLTSMEVDALARFNAEVHHGLVHTPEYAAKMRVLQERFDAKLRLRSDG